MQSSNTFLIHEQLRGQQPFLLSMSRPWLNSGHVCGRKLTIPSVDVEAMSAAAYQTITSVSAMSAAYQNKNIAKQICMRVGGGGHFFGPIYDLTCGQCHSFGKRDRQSIWRLTPHHKIRAKSLPRHLWSRSIDRKQRFASKTYTF